MAQRLDLFRGGKFGYLSVGLVTVAATRGAAAVTREG